MYYDLKHVFSLTQVALFCDKKWILLLYFFSNIAFSQSKSLKKFETKINEIEIYTDGLDDIIIENSNSNFIEVQLVDKNLSNYQIVYSEEFNLIKIQFEIINSKSKTIVFRKFITERLNRVSAVIKLPKNKNITVFGDEINIESKKYLGSLNIYIEKGILKLHEIYSNLLVKMYEGNLYATIKNADLSIYCKYGKVKINNQLKSMPYQNTDDIIEKKVLINSIKANIFLNTK